MAFDITDEFEVDLTKETTVAPYSPNNASYDLSINDIGFVMSVNNQNPYQRETAQYRKDQFDASAEPGEQSLTGWWLRSQTSWHNGAGIRYYEPGTDAAHVTHRFYDSRGIDVWTPGEAKLHNDVFHSYTGANGIVGETANDGTNDIMFVGDSAGALKKVTFNGNSAATASAYSLPDVGSSYSLSSHASYPFLDVTTDGSRYFAVCSTSIHRGNSSTVDQVIYHLGTAKTKATIKFIKGYLMFGLGRSLYLLNADNTAHSQHSSSTADLPTAQKTHQSADWNWNDIVGGNRFIYASGYNNSKSEIWAIPFDDQGTAPTYEPDASAAVVVAELPFGERVNSMYFYLGFLALGTTKGIRICQVATDGSIVLGPLLYDSKYEVTGFVANDKYLWASTTVMGDEGLTNGVLVRVDLSAPFDDGTYAYAYDLQYISDKDALGTGVAYADSRLHIIINEPSETPAGEIQTQHTGLYRTSGWLEGGYIRYATTEPKYFKYIYTDASIASSDSIDIKIIDSENVEHSLVSLASASVNNDIAIGVPAGKQEFIAVKFVFTNGAPNSTNPVLNSYQVKAIPAVKRQRLIQYPLSCFDTDMDRFNVQIGYKGRSYETVRALEALENEGNFVTIVDYRTEEKFDGLIEEVRFKNESSSDKNNSGYGGILLVTVRKM